jgi:hypothetical protein
VFRGVERCRMRALSAFVFVILIAASAAGCGASADRHATDVSSAASSSTGSSASSPTGNVQAKPGGTTRTSPLGTGAGATGVSTAASSPDADSLSRANAICARRNDELRSASPPAGSSVGAILAGSSRRALIERKALEELHKLTLAKSAQGDWQDVLAGSEAALRTTQELAHAAGATSKQAIQRQIALINKPQLGLLASAARAHVNRCASIAGPSVSPAQGVPLP